jgi:hypothetical protein
VIPAPKTGASNHVWPDGSAIAHIIIVGQIDGWKSSRKAIKAKSRILEPG